VDKRICVMGDRLFEHQILRRDQEGRTYRFCALSGTPPSPYDSITHSPRQLDDRYFRGLSGKYDFDLHFVLQEKDATPGEYIVRARGAWFGNRSISAEVHLDVGTYEVLPKVEASRDADVPDVHDVVKKLAERNPQKLRQIGLNYDIANAKGVSEESEDERQKREKKRREDAEQKRREKEAEEKEKADFALWKKDERAEYELWKKERRIRDERERKRQATGDEKSEQASVQGDEAKKTGAVTEERNAAIENSESGRDQPSAIPTTEVQQSPDTETGHQIHLASRNSEECHVIHDHPEPSVKSNASTHQPEHDPGHHASVDGDEPEPSAVKKQDTIVSEEPKPWNAVCVLGLRVCSQDSEVSIKLVKPKDVEEGAILDVDGDTAAGATM